MNLHLLKYPLSILLLGCAVFHLAAQPQDIALRGSVVLQNSKTLTGKTEYLPTVSVKSFKATPTLSDANGLFKLVFASVNMGAKTGIEAKKTGFTVVNAEVLKEAVIIGRTDTLKIVMCTDAQFEENKQRFYNISTENVQRELSRRVAKLQRANAQDKRRLMDSLQNEMNIKLSSSDDAIAQLNARSKALEEQLERIATDFATVNLDDASETYRLAYTAFTEGDVHGSLKILNAIDLRKRLGENVKQLGRRDTLISVMQRQNDTSRTQIAQDIQACLLAANNHKILFQHQEAQSWYELAIDHADTNNLTLLNDYTAYLYEFGEFPRASRFNDIALQRARRLRQTADSLIYTEGYAVALYYRASLLSRRGEEPKANELACLEALPFFQELAQTDTLKRLMLGRLMSDLAQAYNVQEQDSLSILWYNRAIAILALPVSSRRENDVMYYKSIAHLGLGNTYRYMQNLQEAENQCLMSVSLRQQLFQRDSIRYAHFLGLGLSMLSAVYVAQEDFPRAVDSLEAAIRYSSISKNAYPLYSQKEIIRAEGYLAEALIELDRYDSAYVVLDTMNMKIDAYFVVYGDSGIQKQVDFLINTKSKLIFIYLGKRQFSKALNKSAILYNDIPEDGVAMLTRGLTLVYNGQYNQAITILDTLEMNNAIKSDLISRIKTLEDNHITHPDIKRIKKRYNL